MQIKRKNSLGYVVCGVLASVTAAVSYGPQAKALDEIIISGSPLERANVDQVGAITTLDREEIQRQGGATLGELLAKTPGIAESSFAPGASRPVIRGLDNFRVRMQENGIGAHGVSDVSEDHGVPIDPLAAQRIEVIRGPATLRYGSQAIGGVVNVINNRVPTAAPKNLIDGEAFASFNTVNNGFEGGGLFDIGTGHFAGHFDWFYRDTEDYDIPQAPGEQANTQNETLGVSGGGSIVFDDGFIGANVSYFDSEYGIPGEAAADDVFIDLDQTKVVVRGEVRNVSDFVSTLRLDGGYSNYLHDEVEGATGDIGATYDNEEWELRAEALHTQFGPFEGAIGFHFAHRDLEAFGEASELIAPSDRQSYGFFLFEEASLMEGLTLQLATRVEHVELDGFGVTPPSLNGNALMAEIDDFGADAPRDFTPVSGSIGLVFDLGNQIALSGNVQYVERAPALLELYSKGPHEATATFEVGDPNLDKEKAISFEANLKKDEGDLTFGLAGFYTSYDGFIFRQNTGFVCGEEFDTCGIDGTPGVEDELTQLAFLQQDADFYGFEAEAAWRALDMNGATIGFDGQLDFVKAEFDGGANVPRITPLRFGGGVFVECERFFARLGALRVTRQDDVAINETETSGYTNLTLEANYTMPLAGSDTRAVQIGLVGSNLLDQDQRNHVSFLKDDVLRPGASARIFGRLIF